MRALCLAATFGLMFSLIPLRLPAQPSPEKEGRDRAKPQKAAKSPFANPRSAKRLRDSADKRLESFEDRLRRGEGRAVHAAVQELVMELGAAGLEDGRLGAALRALALAEAGSGRRDEAIWHWQVAQNLRPGLVLDPAAYGEAGALLARHKLRRPGEAPAGMEAVAATDLGANSVPPRKVAGDEPKVPTSLASPNAPRWARLQVAIDTQGRVVEPVVLAARSEAFRWAVLEAVRTWRFEPARREGQPVAVLLDIDLPPRAGTPLAEMVPLSGEAGNIHSLLLKHEWQEARTRAAALVRRIAEEGPTDPRHQGAALALLALAAAGSGGNASICYWHAAQSLYGDLYHATLAAYGPVGARLEESNPWVQGEEIFHVGSSPWEEAVVRPEKIAGAVPQYTTRDRLARVRGDIVIDAVIDKDGRVTQPWLLKGLSPGLDLKTLVMLCEWRFKPATLDGRPVSVNYSVTTNFAVF